MKNYSKILIEEQKQYQPYYLVKLVNMNTLQVRNYCLLAIKYVDLIQSVVIKLF